MSRKVSLQDMFPNLLGLKEEKTCEHHDCRCLRAAELAAMGLTVEAIKAHSQQVRCRRAA